jgi:hypothetical protein
MEWAFVAVTSVYFCWSAVVMWKQQKIIERQGEMLAARSYGEFVSGQVRVSTANQERPEFDPGF